MRQIWLFRVSAFAAVSLMLSLSLAAKTGDPKDLLLRSLKTQFVPARFDQDGAEVVTAGTVVALRKDGLLVYGFPAPRDAYPISHYKNGEIFQDKNMIYQSLDCMVFGDYSNACTNAVNAQYGGSNDVRQKNLSAGEKVWIGQIYLRKKEIAVIVVTDPYDDGRYIGELWIPFEEDKLPAPDEAIKLISEVLLVQAAQDQPPPEAALALAPVAAQPATPAPAAMPDIAPPPPPADTPPPTISIGQTVDQVITGFGPPLRIARLGVKEIFYYKDMKVTFMEGKVSDVE